MAIREILEEELENSLRMEREYSAQLEKLPKGSLSRRVRNGHEYFYIVYREGGKVRLDYLGKEVSDEVKQKYEEAKVKRAQLRNLRSKVRGQIKFIEGVLRARPSKKRKPVMKKTDDYRAKLQLWASEGRVAACPKAVGLPRFGSRRFSSGAEMNAWKKELLAETARNGGVQWTN